MKDAQGAGGQGAGALWAGPEGAAAGLPDWLHRLARVAGTIQPRQLSRWLPPAAGGRPSAVLVLFGEGRLPAGKAGSGSSGAAGGAAPPAGGGGAGPELLLLERASSLREHAGQPSFPGGTLDPEDGDPEAEGPLRAALREAEEETGLDPSGVHVFAALPRLYIPVSGFVVTPVLGWWREPSPVAPVDPAETARVFTVPVAELADPARRGTALHPSGYRGPCFEVGGTLVWGFTAGVIDRILHYAGWERPWDPEREISLDGGA